MNLRTLIVIVSLFAIPPAVLCANLSPLTVSEAKKLYLPHLLKQHPNRKEENVQLREITPADVWQKMCVQIFEGTFDDQRLYEVVLIKDHKIHSLTHTFCSGMGQMIVSDLDSDGNQDLIYTFNNGLGRDDLCDPSFVGVYDGKKQQVALSKPWMYRITLERNKNGLSIVSSADVSASAYWPCSYGKQVVGLKQGQVWENTLGPNHPNVARSLFNLAALYHAQGKYAEAELLYKRSLEIRERLLGPSNSDVAQNRAKLAALQRAQKNYADAEYETQINPSVAECLNGLAALYKAQRKYTEAEMLYKRALQIMENWDKHPQVVCSLNGLGELYGAQGKYAEAEPLYKRALKIMENWGKHPDVARCLSNYAELLSKTNRKAEAAELEARADAIRGVNR